jgi:hypothetical protein
MTEFPCLRIIVLSAFLTSAWLGSACGGRSVTIDGAGGLSASGAGGNSSAGGASARAGAGGSTSGAGGCGPVACPNIACAQGELPVTETGSCCPVCEPTRCAPCPGLICGTGSHPETPTGQCCTQCEPNPPNAACDNGQANYALYRDAVVQKAQSLFCNIDSDCLTLVQSDACSQCQSIAVLASELKDLSNGLAQAAAMDCATCMPQSGGVTCGSVPAVCGGGHCQLAEILPVP